MIYDRPQTYNEPVINIPESKTGFYYFTPQENHITVCVYLVPTRNIMKQTWTDVHGVENDKDGKNLDT